MTFITIHIVISCRPTSTTLGASRSRTQQHGGAVYRLFEKPYFWRVWVQQEILASKFYEIVVQCGQASVPWVGLEITAFAMIRAKSVMDEKVYNDAATAGLQDSQMRLAPSALKGVAGFEDFRPTNPDAVDRTLYAVLKKLRGYKAIHVI